MDTIFIYKWLDPQLYLPLQFSSLIILVLTIPPTMIQQISIQLLQIYALYRRSFFNDVEVLDTSMMPELSVALNYSQKVLE